MFNQLFSSLRSFFSWAWDIINPVPIPWFSARAGAVATPYPETQKGLFDYLVSSHIRNTAKALFKEKGLGGRPFYVVKVDGNSQEPNGLKNGDFCVVVPVKPEELQPNDAIVLRLEKDKNNLPTKDTYKFRALEKLNFPAEGQLTTYRFTEDGTKHISHPHNINQLVGKVYFKINGSSL